VSVGSSTLECVPVRGGQGIAETIATAVIFISLFVFKRIYNLICSIGDYFHRIRRILNDVARDTSSGSPREGKGLWLAEPIKQPKILVAHNTPKPTYWSWRTQKRCRKTTVATNIAACIAEGASKPVHLIDLNFQGSASSMSIVGDQQNWLPRPGEDSHATRLLSGGFNEAQIAGWGRVRRL